MRGVGAALPRTSVGEMGGHRRQGTPRAAAKLPEAASRMDKQQERHGEDPAAGFHPRGRRPPREPSPGSIAVKAALGPAAHGRHRLARGVPLHAGRRALQIRASWWSLHELQPPAALSPWASPWASPPCLPLGLPPAPESQRLPSSSVPQEPGGSAGSAWPCFLGFPSWVQHERPRGRSVCAGLPEQGSEKDLRSPSEETPAHCRGAGGCSVLPVTDSDEPALPWGGGQLWVRRCFPCLPGTKAAERRDAVAVDRTEASSPEGPGVS